MAAGFALCTAFSGYGPAQAADTPSPQPKVSETVVVTSSKQPAENAIDRRIYRTGSDIQSSTGSAGDVLRDLPSIDVDAQGNVSLRGDSNVEILIDGKPSTMLSGANRADTLAQMPADSIDRIEVITTPSAQFKPDGSAGIINIITKKSKNRGSSGSLSAGVGSEGRYYLGLSGVYKPSSYSFSGSLNLRQDDRKRQTINDRQTVDPFGGRWVGDAQTVTQQSKRLLVSTALGFDHAMQSGDEIGANASFYYRFAHPQEGERDTATDVFGATASDYDRLGKGYEREISGKASAKYVHKFGEDGHELSLDAQFERTLDHHRTDYTNIYRLPATPSTFDRVQRKDDEQLYEVSLDYTRPLSQRSKLQFGYDLETSNDEYVHLGGALDPASKALTPSPALTNDFFFGQMVHAVYGEYQVGVGRLNVKAGLRLEETLVDINQATTAQTSAVQYGRFYPSLHLEYSLADSHTLRLGYSHRVSRPEPEDMNPYPVWQDAFDFRAGNPHLMPRETHALEASYQYEGGGQTATATLYYRKSRNGLVDVVSYLGNNIFLTTKENLAKSQAGGVEVTGAGKITDGLRYSLTGNMYYDEIDASSLGFAGTKQALGYNAKASLDYQLTLRDRIQVMANYTSKRLTPQGYRLPNYTINLGARHQLQDNLAAVLTISDLMNSYRDVYRLNTPTLQGTNKRRQLGRIVYLGLTYRFGGKASDKDDRFDYSSDVGG